MDFTKLTEYLDSLAEQYGVPGFDCKIMQNHREIYRHMGGWSDYAHTHPVSAGDLYDVYSCTKLITMVAVMQLAERGALSLEDRLDQYLPEFSSMQVALDFAAVPGRMPAWPDSTTPVRPANTPMYLHDLMSMTSGMSYDTESEPIRRVLKDNPYATTREIVAAMAKMPLIYEPGTRWSYSLSHDVMAAVVEVVSGETFGEYLQRHIFAPLGLEEMYLHTPESETSRLSAQYAVDRQTGEIVHADWGNRFRLSPKYDCGGAGLTCGVDGYCTVLDALSCGGTGKNGARILTPESVLEMSRNRLDERALEDFHRGGRFEYGYGLGVRTMMVPGGSQGPVGEFGWDGAAGAYGMVDPVNHVSLFYTQEILGMPKVYSEIHPKLRDLAYIGLRS